MTKDQWKYMIYMDNNMEIIQLGYTEILQVKLLINIVKG